MEKRLHKALDKPQIWGSTSKRENEREFVNSADGSGFEESYKTRRKRHKLPSGFPVRSPCG